MASGPKARWLLPVVLVIMIITAAAAVVARTIYTEPAVADTARPLAVPDGQSAAGGEPGDSKVMGTLDATSHPLYESVRQLLQANFDAINTRNYGLWQSVVSDERAASQKKDKWLHDYGSSTDGSIVVQRIEVGPTDSARVMLSFTSVQDPALAPPELPERCVHWQVVFPLAIEHGTWKLSAGTTGQAPQHQTC